MTKLEDVLHKLKSLENKEGFLVDSEVELQQLEILHQFAESVRDECAKYIETNKTELIYQHHAYRLASEIRNLKFE